MDLPSRHPRLPEDRMRVSCDIDCGELVVGHHFVVRGIADTREPLHGVRDGEEHLVADGFSLEYELVPGVPPAAKDEVFFRFIPQVEYTADVPLPWEVSDGGGLAPFEGGPSTHGSRGDWPIPDGARELRFELFPVEGDSTFASERPAGTLRVDLRERTATWHPNPNPS